MKCISLWQPWASWLANPQKFIDIKIKPKRIENRKYDLTKGYRGPILIHGSRTFEEEAIDYVFGEEDPQALGFPKDYPLGAIVGIAELTDVVTDSGDPWFCGPYGLVLKNARPIEPIAYRGLPGLFEVPDSILAEHGIKI